VGAKEARVVTIEDSSIDRVVRAVRAWLEDPSLALTPEQRQRLEELLEEFEGRYA
jgi:hypothetical protein